MKEIFPQLEKLREIKLDAETRKKLLKISPATVDRLLKDDKKRLMLKSRARKPHTLLKKQIPIRTFSEWDEFSLADFHPFKGLQEKQQLFCETEKLCKLLSTCDEAQRKDKDRKQGQKEI